MHLVIECCWLATHRIMGTSNTLSAVHVDFNAFRNYTRRRHFSRWQLLAFWESKLHRGAMTRALYRRWWCCGLYRGGNRALYRTPSKQNDRHDWKRYLPATYLAGGNLLLCVSNICRNFVKLKNYCGNPDFPSVCSAKNWSVTQITTKTRMTTEETIFSQNQIMTKTLKVTTS